MSGLDEYGLLEACSGVSCSCRAVPSVNDQAPFSEEVYSQVISIVSDIFNLVYRNVTSCDIDRVTQRVTRYRNSTNKSPCPIKSVMSCRPVLELWDIEIRSDAVDAEFGILL